jgi:tetratricopeptide (TPR) repeat protein
MAPRNTLLASGTSPPPGSPLDLLKQAETKARQTSLSHTQSWESVAERYRRIISNGGDAVEAREGLAEALFRLGNLGAAIKEARGAWNLAGEDAKLTNTLASYLRLAGREEEALPLARAASAADPANIDYQDTLAHASYGTSPWQEAAFAWQRVLRAKPDYFRDRSHIRCREDQANYIQAQRLTRTASGQELPPDPFAPG